MCELKRKAVLRQISLGVGFPRARSHVIVSKGNS